MENYNMSFVCKTCSKTYKRKYYYDKHVLTHIDTNTFVDLFCGTGAFSYVLEKKKCKCVLANDMVQSSQKIYNLNNEEKVFKLCNLNDIKTEEIPPHNILCGGFPCQPFSIAGQRKGFKDERSNVFWKIIDILKQHKPGIIVLENVKNLTTHDKGNTFKIIKEKLNEIGYNLKWKILNTCKITPIPQNRERIYIIGFLDKEKFKNFAFDFTEQKNINISELLEEKIADKYYYTKKLKVFDKINNAITKNIKTNTVYQYRRHYIRENKSNVCPTLTANMGGGGHNVPLIKDDKGIRKLTPRECFNLQGFPKNYKLPNISDSQLYKLAGNAVSIPVLELLFEKLI